MAIQNLNYGILQPLSANNSKNKTERASDSDDCKGELTKYLQNFQEYAMRLSVYEAASLLIAEQDWIKRGATNKTFEEDLIGKVLKVDFGKTYLHENGFIHYAVCISECNGKYCVIPTTTANDEIKAAYHPEFRPNGEKRLYLLKKSEGSIKDCALYINDMKFISTGRIIGVGNKISDTAYNDITNLACEICFRQLYSLLEKKDAVINEQTQKIQMLEEKCHILTENNALLSKMFKKSNKKA